MKWIRTESDYILNMTLKNANAEFRMGGYKIKLQSDNLIDVLKENDLLYFKNTKTTVTIMKLDNELVFLNYSYVNNNTFIETITNDILMDIDCKIVTHEQYMPHVQDITND